MVSPSAMLPPDVLAHIVEAIRGVKFGTVQVTIHNSCVVQIEKAEKIRFDQDADPTTGGSASSHSWADRAPGSLRSDSAR